MKITVEIEHTKLMVAPPSGSAWRLCLACGAEGFPDGVDIKIRQRPAHLRHQPGCPVAEAFRVEGFRR